MENLASLSATAVLVAFVLGLLALAVSRLGKSLGLGSALQVLGLVILKFALLVLGLRWMSQQAWFRPVAAAWGASIALVIFVLFKGRSKPLEKEHG